MKLILLFMLVVFSSIYSKDYKRIIIMDPSMVEAALLLGVEEKIVGIGQLGKTPVYPEEKTKNIKKVGNPFRPSVEKIILENPDLIVVNEGFNFPEEEFLKRDIEVVKFKNKKIEDSFENLKKFAQLIGKEKEADEILKNGKNRIKELKNLNKNNMKGIFIYSTSPLLAFNGESLPGDILKILNIENIAENLKGNKPIVSVEYLLKENPDIIVGMMTVKSIEDLQKSIPNLEYTNAWKNKNIFLFDARTLYRNSPEVLDGVQEFYNKIN